MLTTTNDHERKALERKAAEVGIECLQSFYMFFVTFWDTMSGENYIDNWHIKYICDVLQDKARYIINGETIRSTVIINVPPGSSKSTVCTVAFPLWVWLHKPSCTTVNISFSGELAKEHQELSKTIPSSSKWHLLFDKILEVKYGKPMTVPVCNKNKVQNNFGGKRFNASVGGTVTGRHADIIIEDDPLNPEQAFSEAERQTAIRFHDKTISTRKKNDNCYLNIIIAQRLHEEDVCGHVLKKNLDITHICLPGEITNSTFISPPDAANYYKDGILNPIRKGREVLDDLKESMGGDAFTTQVLQLPFDIQNQDITPDMFNIVHEKELSDNITWDVWIDGAYTEKTENDPTGIDVIARVGNNIIVKDSFDVRLKLPDLVQYIKDLEEANIFNKLTSRVFIEPKASGYSLAQYIESDTDYNFVLIGEHNKAERKLVNEGKKARHEMIKPKAQSRRLTLVEGTWNDHFITQVCGFPRAAHDEHVDNLGYAVNHYYMAENLFLKEYAINSVETIAGFNVEITSQITNKVNATYAEQESGDTVMYDYPYSQHLYRYICVLVLRDYDERGGVTSITVYDRLNGFICASYNSDSVETDKAAIKALEMANLYDKAKLIITNKAGTSESDLSHIALAKIRSIGYENLYFRLTLNDIKMKKEKEFGFVLTPNSAREVFFNFKEKLEKKHIKELPDIYHEELRLIERKKETGEIAAKEGYQINNSIGLAIALLVDNEMYDKPKVRVHLNRR